MCYSKLQFLIGTVQQQYLLRFLFSLYPISPVFQPFFEEFLTIFVSIKKNSGPLTKNEASFEYLNHTHDPAFAVHPCPSPIFCHQEDKSELRGATPNFLPRLSPQACTGLAACKFHRPFRIQTQSFCHMATFTGYFRYRRISPPSKQSALLALPLSYQLPHRYPLGLFLHRRRLLLHPEVPCI